MHSIDVGIGRYDYLIITQCVEPVFDVESGLKKVEFLVVIDHFFRQFEGVEWLSTQRKHRLSIDVAHLCDASAGRVALGDEDARFLLAVVFHVAVVDAAVAQFFIVQIGLFRPFTRLFRHTSQFLALAFALFHLGFDGFGHVAVDVQVVIDLLFDEIAYVFVDGLAVGCHLRRTEFDFRLTLEHRFLDVDGDGGHKTVANVAVFVFPEKFLDGAGDVFLESRLMGAALNRVLTVDEGIIFLAVLVGVGQRNFDVLALQMDDGVERVVGHSVFQQVFQAVARQDSPTVVHNRQTRIQIGIVAQHRFDDVVVERVVFEKRVVGFEEDERAVFVLRRLGGVARHNTSFEGDAAHLSVAIGTSLEARTQEVHRLDAHAVHSDRLLKRLRVVFSARVELADGLDEFSLRNTASVVAHRYAKVVVDVDFDAFSGVHPKFVNRVVDGLFQ